MSGHSGGSGWSESSHSGWTLDSFEYAYAVWAEALRYVKFPREPVNWNGCKYELLHLLVSVMAGNISLVLETPKAPCTGTFETRPP